MKKRPFANSRCAEEVRTSKETKVSSLQEETYREESTRPESYRQKTKSVIHKLREQTQRTRIISKDEYQAPTKSWFDSSKLHEEQKSQEKHLNSLESLSYQARFSTQIDTRKEALEGLVVVDRFAEPTLKTLEEALEDPVAEIRVKSSELLRTFPSPLPDTMMDKLIARAWDPELIVRRSVAKTLANHPDPRSIGPLMGLLGTQDDELHDIVHQSLIEICKKLGPPPPRTDGDT